MSSQDFALGKDWLDQYKRSRAVIREANLSQRRQCRLFWRRYFADSDFENKKKQIEQKYEGVLLVMDNKANESIANLQEALNINKAKHSEINQIGQIIESEKASCLDNLTDYVDMGFMGKVKMSIVDSDSVFVTNVQSPWRPNKYHRRSVNAKRSDVQVLSQSILERIDKLNKDLSTVSCQAGAIDDMTHQPMVKQTSIERKNMQRTVSQIRYKYSSMGCKQDAFKKLFD